jgi:hypothetical protein
MLYFITGAGGAGKSAVLPRLRGHFPDIAWHEFDSLGVPSDADTRWRQRTLEAWLQKSCSAQADGQGTGIVGQVAIGEILAAPSAPLLSGIALCLLDCDDLTRIDRMRERGSEIDQDMLNWAAWLRVHAVDPAWRPDVVMRDGEEDYVWQRWKGWQRGEPRWCVFRLDTTRLTISDVGERLADWIRREAEQPVNPVAQA